MTRDRILEWCGEVAAAAELGTRVSASAPFPGLVEALGQVSDASKHGSPGALREALVGLGACAARWAASLEGGR